MTAPTFVLVHGAWHGGWCWRAVAQRLLATGARVHMPTLTGLGERAHLHEPVPGLYTHIDDVAGLIETEELEDVVLVGHSYAGMVITGVADRLAGRVRHLVYLDAAVPRDGDDFISQHPGLDQAAATQRRQALTDLADGTGWLPPYPPDVMGVTDPATAAWLRRRLRPHPLRSWLEPLRMTHSGGAMIPRTYVLATDPPTEAMGYPLHGAQARDNAEWHYREIACGHNMMVIDPAATSEILRQAVEEQR